MVLYVDLTLGKFVGAPGFASSPRAIEHKRGDGGDVTIQFCNGTDLVSLETGSEIIYQGKIRGEYDANPLIECAAFAEPGTAGDPHTGPLSYDVATLQTLFAVDGDESNDVAQLEVMYEVSWKLPGKGWASTDTLNGFINNDVIRSDEGVLPEIAGDVPGVAASVDLVFDNSFAAAVDVTAGLVAVGDWSVRFWDGTTGSAPAEPYLLYVGGTTIWNTWVTSVGLLLQGSAIPAGNMSLVGTLGAHPDVTPSSTLVGDVLTLTLTAKQTGVAGNSITYSWATLPDDSDDDGTLSGGVDSRDFVQDDFVSTLADTLTEGQKITAISNLIQNGAFTVVGDLEAGDDGTTGLILHSPDGSRWRVTVDNAGTLATASI